MSLFGDNPFGATPLDNAGVVEPCEDDCKPLTDYSRSTLEQLQHVFAQRKRKSDRERLALFTAIESRLHRRPRPAKTWAEYARRLKAEGVSSIPSQEEFDATIWAVRSERAPLMKMLKALYSEVFPHRVWVPGCRTLL